ncbi:hypothetical protein MTR_3g087272 [Medicago truncatula]|uniref:Uncharacterized protein n=1 Tax=Medicago truncatula TaxID=3880 RepID=A0A072V0I0_MEDTR|nr:hypothetical protein MTR_3g087272 [Medicago truncatula]
MPTEGSSFIDGCQLRPAFKNFSQYKNLAYSNVTFGVPVMDCIKILWIHKPIPYQTNKSQIGKSSLSRF